MKKRIAAAAWLILSLFASAQSIDVSRVDYQGHWKILHTQEGRKVKLLDVPDVRQATTYTCGPSALQAVLMYWGDEYREGPLAELAGADPECGTPPERLAALAVRLGYRAEIRQRCTEKDLEAWIDAGIPVIVDIQAWIDEEDGVAWPDRWEDGHYVVAIGYDERNFYFEDPSILGGIGFIPRKELLERWHDYEGAGPYDPKTSVATRNLVIVIRGERPNPGALIQYLH